MKIPPTLNRFSIEWAAMDLIKESIKFLKEQNSTSVLATPEEYDYFTPRKVTSPAPKENKVSADIDLEMRQLVTKVLPEIPLTTKIPDDTNAKKRAQLWKEHLLTTQVLVLSFGETDQVLEFLQNVTKAINSLLAPARLVEMRKMERDNSWDLTLSSETLKLIVAPPFPSWKTLSLSRYYRENPASKTHFLREIPLVFMQPASSYLKNPELKKDLWKTLSSLLSSSTSP